MVLLETSAVLMENRKFDGVDGKLDGVVEKLDGVDAKSGISRFKTESE